MGRTKDRPVGIEERVLVYVTRPSNDMLGNSWRRFHEYTVSGKTAYRMLRRNSAELVVDRIAGHLLTMGVELVEGPDVDVQLLQACKRVGIAVNTEPEPEPEPKPEPKPEPEPEPAPAPETEPESKAKKAKKPKE